jgi:hypothetical protein
MKWIAINGHAYTPEEYLWGEAFDGLRWNRLPPRFPVPAPIIVTDLQLAMAVSDLIKSMQPRRRRPA